VSRGNMTTEKFTDINGVTYHYKGRKLHREDGPAIEYPDGGKSYWVNGERHREDGPAYDCKDVKWFYHGKLIDAVDMDDFKRQVNDMIIRDVMES
jgi:hypothetical protein